MYRTNTSTSTHITVLYRYRTVRYSWWPNWNSTASNPYRRASMPCAAPIGLTKNLVLHIHVVQKRLACHHQVKTQLRGLAVFALSRRRLRFRVIASACRSSRTSTRSSVPHAIVTLVLDINHRLLLLLVSIFFFSTHCMIHICQISFRKS